MGPFLDMCRLCGQKKKMVVDLFTGHRGLLNKIATYLALKITMEDTLPKVVCLECQRHVDQFHAFRMKCLQAEQKLSSIVSGTISSTRTASVVKEEIGELENRNRCCPNSEHNYFAATPTPTPGKVKKEVSDELDLPEQPVDEPDHSDSELISTEIVFEKVQDAKHPIIEVVVDSSEDIIQNLDLVASKVEIDVVTFECKPVIPPPKMMLESMPAVSENSIEKDMIDGFNEQDLVLQENEKCDVDMEEMEATLMKKANPDMRFKCRKCRRSFKFFKGLKKHEKLHMAPDQLFGCNFCLNATNVSRGFSNLKTLKGHILTSHLNQDEVRCRACPEKFQSPTGLKNHLKEVHAMNQYPCQECSKVFKQRSILTTHMRVHRNEKPYVCGVCGQSFRWPSAFHYHRQAHLQAKHFLCAQCGNKFATKKTLLEHLNIHQGKKPYSCHLCLRSFTHASTLKRHEDWHKGKGPIPNCHRTRFSCNLCSGVFRTACNLSNHKKTHEEKQLSCTLCGAKFRRTDHLRDHMGRHTGHKHKCPAPQCSKMYSQRYPLTSHFRNHHPDMVLVGKRGGRSTSGIKRQHSVGRVVTYQCHYKADAQWRISKMMS